MVTEGRRAKLWSCVHTHFPFFYESKTQSPSQFNIQERISGELFRSGPSGWYGSRLPKVVMAALKVIAKQKKKNPHANPAKKGGGAFTAFGTNLMYLALVHRPSGGVFGWLCLSLCVLLWSIKVEGALGKELSDATRLATSSSTHHLNSVNKPNPISPVQELLPNKSIEREEPF